MNASSTTIEAIWGFCLPHRYNVAALPCIGAKESEFDPASFQFAGVVDVDPKNRRYKKNITVENHTIIEIKRPFFVVVAVFMPSIGWTPLLKCKPKSFFFHPK